MRFVGVKQQSIMMLHRVRLILTHQRTQLSNALRSHLAEFGIVSPIGREGLDRLLEIVADTSDKRVPQQARASLAMLAVQLEGVKVQLLENDRQITTSAKPTEIGRRLMEIPGMGPVLASAFVATVADPAMFKSGRNLAAWIGLVPRQNSSGGKERSGGISKAGHRYLRQMLVVGAMAVIRHAERNAARKPWLAKLLERRKIKVAAVALASKTVRTVWALMSSGERYRDPLVARPATVATACGTSPSLAQPGRLPDRAKYLPDPFFSLPVRAKIFPVTLRREFP
jgi:transposase